METIIVSCMTNGKNVNSLLNWYLEAERDDEEFEKGRCPLCSEDEDAIHILDLQTNGN
jgi:hypothetical protein